jgi:hypothetical protein
MSTALFNAKQAYLWLLVIVAGGLVFPDDIVAICLYSETLHTFKTVVLNQRLCSMLLLQKRSKRLAQGFAALAPLVGTITFAFRHSLSGAGAVFVCVGLLFVSLSEAVVDLVISVLMGVWRTSCARKELLLSRGSVSAGGERGHARVGTCPSTAANLSAIWHEAKPFVLRAILLVAPFLIGLAAFLRAMADVGGSSSGLAPNFNLLLCIALIAWSEQPPCPAVTITPTV